MTNRVKNPLSIRNTRFEYDSPVLWTTAAWLLALISWAVAPDYLVYYFIPKGRYFSFSSAAFFILCFGFFWCGLKIGTRIGMKHSARRLPLADCWQDAVLAKKLLGKIMYACTVLVLFGVACQIIHTMLIFKGLAQEPNINAIVQHRIAYRNATIQGITILKYLSLPGFVLATIGCALAKKWRMQRTRIRLWILQLLSLIIPVFSALLGSRLIALMWVIPFCYLKIGLMHRIHQRDRSFKTVIKMALAVVLIFGVLYSTGHYVRHYERVLSGRVPIKTYAQETKGFFNYTFLTFLGYPFRTINNGLVIVDHIEQHTYFWRSFRWLYSGFGIEKLDPGGFIHSAKENMYLLDYLGLAYFRATNSSLPGYLFIDLGWLALIVILLLGMFVGVFYQLWRKTAVMGWLVTPITIAPLMDSWRTDIFFRSVNMVCIFVAVAAGLYLEKKCRPLWRRTAKHILEMKSPA
jgi:hypothetical protein